ncbi:hypothetical protein C8J56DRAFT_883457 [Mycena floridula]|nr:hypothetical protein C8J56DRAFT_883457 [Mycena floridula]
MKNVLGFRPDWMEGTVVHWERSPVVSEVLSTEFKLGNINAAGQVTVWQAQKNPARYFAVASDSQYCDLKCTTMLFKVQYLKTHNYWANKPLDELLSSRFENLNEKKVGPKISFPGSDHLPNTIHTSFEYPVPRSCHTIVHTLSRR